MIEAQRRAYLEAMGFDVWVSRAAAGDAAAGGIQMGPGQGSTLLVCAAPEESAGKFAGDLARALGDDPVWAWPDRVAAPDGLALEEAIAARLITRVVVLGADVARWLFANDVPAAVGSASVMVAAGIEELCIHGSAKQALWRGLSGETGAATDDAAA